MTPKTIARRIRTKDGGFTLVELMVVVMIIAILMAIAIPTFLNSRKRAQDSAARSNVRNALSAAQSVFSETQAYSISATMATSLGAEEPSLSFEAAPTGSTGPKVISVMTDTAAASVVVAALSDAKNCFATKHVAASGAGGGSVQWKLDGADSTTCVASANLAAPWVVVP